MSPSTTVHINLAPEVYQKSQRDKAHRRLALTIGIMTSIVALAITVIAALILGGQTVAINLLKQSISDRQQKIQGYSELTKAVTAQQHLDSWQQLYNQKILISRFFQVLEQVSPIGISVSNVTLDQTNTLKIVGTTSSYQLVTKFVQALQASNTQIGPNASPTQPPYFSNLQLAAVSESQPGVVSYQITTQMSPQVVTGGQ